MTTTTTRKDPLTLELRKTVKAPVEKVYRAWTEPAHISKWFGCGKTADVRVEQDLRVNGAYRYEMHCTDGEIAVVTGTFKEIVVNEKLSYTWSNTSAEFPAKNTLVTVQFTQSGDTTEIFIRHENFAATSTVEGHTMGWGAALEKFAEVATQLS